MISQKWICHLPPQNCTELLGDVYPEASWVERMLWSTPQLVQKPLKIAPKLYSHFVNKIKNRAVFVLEFIHIKFSPSEIFQLRSVPGVLWLQWEVALTSENVLLYFCILPRLAWLCSYGKLRLIFRRKMHLIMWKFLLALNVSLEHKNS